MQFMQSKADNWTAIKKFFPNVNPSGKFEFDRT